MQFIIINCMRANIHENKKINQQTLSPEKIDMEID